MPSEYFESCLCWGLYNLFARNLEGSALIVSVLCSRLGALNFPRQPLYGIFGLPPFRFSFDGFHIIRCPIKQRSYFNFSKNVSQGNCVLLKMSLMLPFICGKLPKNHLVWGLVLLMPSYPLSDPYQKLVVLKH